MSKIQQLFGIILILLGPDAVSQENYLLHIHPVDKDSVFIQNTIAPKNRFTDREDCLMYIDQMLSLLQGRGYITASIDYLKTDTTAAWLTLYIGDLYKWETLTTTAASRAWLNKIGWNEELFHKKIVNYDLVSTIQERMLRYFENNGYPFAKIGLDSVRITGNKVSGVLNVNSGPLYKIDSIKISGNAKISNEYLQSYLGIKNGTPYSQEKLQQISSLIKKLSYVEEEFPPRFFWSSTGGVVEVYLKQKKTSQVNLIIGLLPNNDPVATRKLQITGEGVLHLKNALGSGETIGLDWQKLQAASQRLRIVYQQPYLFRSAFGLDFSFDMLKRDSAYLNFQLQLGAQMALSSQQSAKIFIQQFSTIVSSVNLNHVLQTRTLPNEADVRLTNLGVEYEFNNTNYIFNPVRGTELLFTTSAGNKQIKPNNQVLELKDEQDPGFDFRTLYDTIKTKSYQWRSVVMLAQYFPLGRKNHSTLKTAVHGAYLRSPNIFRNELFQIGGHRLLRGFDEQSQYLSQYALGTIEYRYLFGENSFFAIFMDGGWGSSISGGARQNYNFLGTGLGMVFETKVGLFNLAWAVGKRNDTQFNLRQSKIHFGFVNYF